MSKPRISISIFRLSTARRLRKLACRALENIINGWGKLGAPRMGEGAAITPAVCGRRLLENEEGESSAAEHVGSGK